MKSKLLVIVLTIMSLNCFAQDTTTVGSAWRKAPSQSSQWIYIGETDNGKVYMKTDYVSKDYSGIKVWSKWVYTIKKVNGKLYKNVVEKTLFKANCDDKQIKSLSTTTYNSNGKVIDTFRDDDYEMDDVVPDSIGESILNTVCKLFNY